MATRRSIDECLQHCEDTLRNAQDQYKDGLRQEHWDDNEYTSSLQQVEATLKELDVMNNSANKQQKEQLYRMRLQLQQLQNEMILLDH
ncbi:YtzC family protein [Bacillus fonticola]|uniref:YtzC family protein n=1 Tax=Bacillus fonticola TaxID=2728853 RepID=UPI001475C1E7|nr:YtzC family protein [Bacillus fonticola]